MRTLWHDTLYALRQLRRTPVFTLTAVLTLALGLGGAATMYRVVDAVLLAPLPYSAPEQLVGVGFTFPAEKPNNEQTGATAEFLRAHSRSFASVGIAEDGLSGVNLSFVGGADAPVQVQARLISHGYLPTLGAAPLLGRGFTREEDLPHGPHVALLGYALWQHSFGLFGLLSYQVAQRRREFGLRLAVGAPRGRILTSVVRRGLALTGIGLALGLIASLALPRLVGSVLADIVYTGDAPGSGLLGSTAEAALIAASALLLAALVACSMPAWRASRVDPLEALRSE